MARYVNGLTRMKYAKITNDNERYIDMGEFSEVVADARQTGCISIICTQGCKRLKLNKELCTALEEPSCVKVLLGKDEIAIVHVEEGTPNAFAVGKGGVLYNTDLVNRIVVLAKDIDFPENASTRCGTLTQVQDDGKGNLAAIVTL